MVGWCSSLSRSMIPTSPALGTVPDEMGIRDNKGWHMTQEIMGGGTTAVPGTDVYLCSALNPT